MKASAIIAEDEVPQREDLVRQLKAVWADLEILAECGDGLSALEALEERQPQIVFLDIRMPGLSGLDVARAASGRSHVVFVTAYDEHALEAFEAGAADYLLKPVTADRLAVTVERLQRRMKQESPGDLTSLLTALEAKMKAQLQRGGLKWVTASIGDTVKMFPIEDVLFFQAQDKYVRVVTAEAEAVIRTPLKELLSQLDPDEYWQIHRSVIVRASAIDRAKKNELGHLYARLKGVDEKLPVSTAYQWRFRSM